MAYAIARTKKNRLYIYFRLNGQALSRPTNYYCVKNGDKNCSCKQCKAANELASEITRKIDSKEFKISDYFYDKDCLNQVTVIDTTENVLFNQYINQWLDEKESVVAYSTIRGYNCINRKIKPYVKDLRLVDVKPAHIRNIVSRLVKDGLAAKTVKNAIFMLSNVFEFAKNDGVIISNPVKGVPLPKVRVKEPDPFSIDEVRAILNDIEKHDPDMAAFFAIGFYTGMRTGEILALQWNDIDFIKHTIYVHATHTANKRKETPKTNNPHYVDIIQELDYYIEKQKQYTFLQDSFLFLNQYSKPFLAYSSIVKRYWRPSLQRLGIRYRIPYQMRHTFACMMLDAGENIKWVANMLGHTDISMVTKRYGNGLVKNDGRAGKRFHANNVTTADKKIIILPNIK